MPLTGCPWLPSGRPSGAPGCLVGSRARRPRHVRLSGASESRECWATLARPRLGSPPRPRAGNLRAARLAGPVGQG
eukprot:11204087-Lingulodinium_polyedra.AAC.1